ncbi:MAG: hypothetical protein ACO23O_12995, partial [Ilumatobacteraceae bacterium]
WLPPVCRLGEKTCATVVDTPRARTWDRDQIGMLRNVADLFITTWDKLETEQSLKEAMAQAQAVTQAHAISRIRSIERILAFDVDDDVATSFADRVRFLGVDVELLDRADAVLGVVDVLCTCTSVDIGAGPVVSDDRHRSGLHVNAVGADFPGKTELPRTMLERAFVVPDVTSQCRAEGECQQLDTELIGPELAELVRSPELAAPHRRRLSVYDSTGWAVQDAVALELAVELAERLGIGEPMQLEHLPSDPYDPYGHTIA